MSKRTRAYAWNRNFPKFSERFVSTRTQQPHDFHGFNHPLDNGEPILPSEENMNNPLDKNEDGTYTLTLGQIEDLANGKSKLINGRIYLDGSQINMKLEDLSTGSRQCFQDLDHPNPNLPTQTQIERCKQFPPVEIKGVVPKGSDLNTKVSQAVEQLTVSVRINGGKYPYTWVEEARMLADFAGNKSIPLLLEILNAAIPLKKGMKLEGFSAKEFKQKYLYSRPSLLEQWVHDPLPTLNRIRVSDGKNLGPLTPTAEDLIPQPIDINQVVKDPAYFSLEIEGMENSNIKELEVTLRELCYHVTGKDNIDTFQEFTFLAGRLYGEYMEHVHMLDPEDFDPGLTKWTIAIHLQHGYWKFFRGRTITILKLFNKFLNPDNELYHLETPIPGMK